MGTIILGSGIIGASTAYYLSLSSPPTKAEPIHIVEPSPTLFASASGFAGGFLAKDWFSSASASLGALSFAEHKRLAEENDGARTWGYAPSTATSYVAGDQAAAGRERGDDWLREGTSRADAASGKTLEAGNRHHIEWLNRGKGSVEVLSEEGSAAQVCVWLSAAGGFLLLIWS